ncbi:carbohydrate ABC transporter permease, partial [Streptococcus gallolyticus subsp. gallolyticus]|nr:carbohydrate ABC transporter permease [Streptococcus gallolyticus subsp. gallolyticus]
MKKIEISKWLSYIFLIALCVIWVIPLIFGFVTSFR